MSNHVGPDHVSCNNFCSGVVSNHLRKIQIHCCRLVSGVRLSTHIDTDTDTDAGYRYTDNTTETDTDTDTDTPITDTDTATDTDTDTQTTNIYIYRHRSRSRYSYEYNNICRRFGSGMRQRSLVVLFVAPCLHPVVLFSPLCALMC